MESGDRFSSLSREAQLVGKWAAIDESYVPPALQFDEDGFPSVAGCQDFNRIYQDVNNLYEIPHEISSKRQKDVVAFLHIPKNGASVVTAAIEGVFRTKPAYTGDFTSVGRRNTNKKKKKKKNNSKLGEMDNSMHSEFDCSVFKDTRGTTCGCSNAHIPPRYAGVQTYEEGQSLLCVARDPLERAIAYFKSKYYSNGATDASTGSNNNNNNHNSSEEFQRSLTAWLTNLPEEVSESSKDYCHIMPQYEYFWNHDGKRTCHYVLSFEGGIESGLNALFAAYDIDRHLEPPAPAAINTDQDLPFSSSTSSSSSSSFSLAAAGIPREAVAAGRRFYWRDYCLLGYYDREAAIGAGEEGGRDTIPESRSRGTDHSSLVPEQQVLLEQLEEDRLQKGDGKKESEGKREQHFEASSAPHHFHSQSHAPHSGPHSLAVKHNIAGINSAAAATFVPAASSSADVPAAFLRTGRDPSPQVRAAAFISGAVDETFLPPSMSFDEHGLPSAEGCRDFNALYTGSGSDVRFSHSVNSNNGVGDESSSSNRRRRVTNRRHLEQMRMSRESKSRGLMDSSRSTSNSSRIIDSEHHLAFLHIPGNTGGAYLSYFTAASPELHLPQSHLTKAAPSRYCSNPHHTKGSSCTCDPQIVPPRHFLLNPYRKHRVFCVVRDPLDRALAHFKALSAAAGAAADGAGGSSSSLHFRSPSQTDLNKWMTQLVASFHQRSGDNYCQVMAQYEYIWDARGKRTCDHVIRYEDGVARGVNAIFDAYGMVNQSPVQEECVTGSALGSLPLHGYSQNAVPAPPVLDSITVRNLPVGLAATVRKFYWRDYCLLGYNQDNPLLDNGAATAGIASTGDQARRGSSATVFNESSCLVTPTAPTFDTAATTTWDGDGAPEEQSQELPEWFKKKRQLPPAVRESSFMFPSPQVQMSRAGSGPGVTMNESFVPRSLEFDSLGYPSRYGCEDFVQMYFDVKNLYTIPKYLNSDFQAAALRFLPIPNNAEKPIAEAVHGVFRLYNTVDATSPSSSLSDSAGSIHPSSSISINGKEHAYCDDDQFEGSGGAIGTACQCASHHNPPRYVRDFRDTKVLFCVVRDPLDRALEHFRSIHPQGTIEEANSWLRSSIRELYSNTAGDQYCQLMPQYEYLWNEMGRRTCHYVIRYEDGLVEKVNSLLGHAHQLESDTGSKVGDSAASISGQSGLLHLEHFGDGPGGGPGGGRGGVLTVESISQEVAVEVRQFYWRDYCLLDYQRNNPWQAASSSSSARVESGFNVFGSPRGGSRRGLLATHSPLTVAAAGSDPSAVPARSGASTSTSTSADAVISSESNGQSRTTPTSGTTPPLPSLDNLTPPEQWGTGKTIARVSSWWDALVTRNPLMRGAAVGAATPEAGVAARVVQSPIVVGASGPLPAACSLAEILGGIGLLLGLLSLYICRRKHVVRPSCA